MTRLHRICAPALIVCAATAQAADLKSNKFSVSSEYTNFSGGFGKRLETSAESTTDLGKTAFTISASHGKRKYENDSFSAARLSGTVYHDWSGRFYTRTSAAVSSNKPVYATRELANDFNYKLLPNAVLTVGGKYARYYDNTDALSWSAGGTWYFASGLVTYRYTGFDVQKLGKSHGHLASFRLKDGGGSTQLWLGAGTSLHEQQLQSVGREGRYRSVAVQRVQPIKGPVALSVSINRSWYDTPGVKYRGTTASVGLTFNRWPKL
jgi:YaiO family outer membrane protein